MKYFFVTIGLAISTASFFIHNDFSSFFLFFGLSFAIFPLIFLSGIYRARKKKAKKLEYLKQNGRKASATILSSESTGVKINNQPQYRFHLEVKIEGKDSYQITTKHIVDIVDINSYQTNKSFPAYVDQNNPEDIVILWNEGLGKPKIQSHKKNYNKTILTNIAIYISIVFLFIFMFGGGLSDKQKQEIMKTGTKTTAVLVSHELSGNITNSIPGYDLTFKIIKSDSSTMEYTEEVYISPLALQNVKVGMKIPTYISKDGETIYIRYEDAGVNLAFD